MSDRRDQRDHLLHVLSEIARLAGSVGSGDHAPPDGEADGYAGPAARKGARSGCTLLTLPDRLREAAARTAVEYNPVNAPAMAVAELVDDPARVAVLTTKYWGPTPRRLTVSFLESAPADLRRRIVSHLNGWNRTAGISFVETGGVGNVRISRGSGGYYSYLGTDVLHIPPSRQTMNLQGFTMGSSEAEFLRVVRHEAGHTLGFPHEHMRRELVARIDPAKAYAYFGRPPNNWSRATVDAQVLTPLDDRTIMRTPADQDSIMCYQLPGSITRDGRPIPGGRDINATDAAFAARIYPKPGAGRRAAAAESADGYDEPAEAADDDFLLEPMALAD